MTRIAIPVLALLLAAPGAAQALWFVSGDGTPAGDGSVLNPFGSIQQAINAANPGDTLLVSPGTYAEDINFTGKAILLRSTTGASFTTIQGTGAQPVVLFASGEGSGSVLEGFTITGGSATQGGGIRCAGASPILRRNIVTGNAATSGGGIAAVSGGAPAISMCTVYGNTTTGIGGGIAAGSAATTVADSIVWGNSSGIGGTPTVSFSDVQGGVLPGPGNISTDPLFVAPASLDFALQPTSPCIGTADNGRDMGAKSFQDPPLAFSMSQSGGSLSALSIQNQFGGPNQLYLTFLSLDQNNGVDLGGGPVFGLHISVPDFLAQIALPIPPFAGFLNSSGSSTFVIPAGALGPGAIGLPIYGVSLTVNTTTGAFFEAAFPAGYVYQ